MVSDATENSVIREAQDPRSVRPAYRIDIGAEMTGFSRFRRRVRGPNEFEVDSQQSSNMRGGHMKMEMIVQIPAFR
jgi:hypothetical protein